MAGAASPQPEPHAEGEIDEVGESIVRVPTRRVPVPPVPLAVRLGDEHGPVRRWAPLGTVDSPVLAEVDPAGRIRPVARPWSLDWWVGAEDGWHHPSMASSRATVGFTDSPVHEVGLRVPGGTVRQLVGGVVAYAPRCVGPAVSVEIRNDSAVPVALALVISPWELDGPGRVDSVELEFTNPDGCVVTIDGEPALVLPRRPARAVSGPTGEVAAKLAAGSDEHLECARSWLAGEAGDLELALVMPLAHTATARVLVMPGKSDERGRGRRRRRRESGSWASGSRTAKRGDAVASAPFDVPTLDSVAKGWAAHSADDPSVTAPYESWSDLVAFSGPVLRVAGPAEVTRSLDPSATVPAGPGAGARLGSVSEALAGLNAPDAAAAVATALAGAQRFSGRVEPADRSDATAALCWSAAAVLTGDVAVSWAQDLVGPVAKAVRWLDRCESKGHRDGIGGVGPWRCAASLRRLASGLVAIGQPEVAQDALDVSGRLDGVAVEHSRAVEDLTVSTFATSLADRDAGRSGSSLGLTAMAERIPPRRFGGLADMAGAGSAVGFDAAELAETRLAVLDALVSDSAAGPVVLPTWPDEWAGRAVEAHRVRTSWGLVSAALRWHGRRPALLWEVTPVIGAAGSAAPAVRVPGLDDGFVGDTWVGEALLADPADVRGADPAGRIGADGASVGVDPGAPGAPAEGESFS